MKTSYLPWAILGVTALSGCSGDDGGTTYPTAGGSTFVAQGGAFVGMGGSNSQTGVLGQGGSKVGLGGAGTALRGGASSATGGKATATGGAASTGGGSAKGGAATTGGGSAKGGTTAKGGGSAKGGTAGTAGTVTSGGRACTISGADVISDFEDHTGSMNPAVSSTGYWYVYADPTAGTQTPPAVASGPIAAAQLPAAEQTTCSLWAMHSTATTHPEYVGFGGTFKPNGELKGKLDVSAYDGITFRIKAGTGQGTTPVYFEVMTTDTQPSSAGGTATCTDSDTYNNRGVLLQNISSTWTQVHVPFATLAARWLPASPEPNKPRACTKYETPLFIPTNAVGIQFSVLSDHTKDGKYDLWVDDVAFYKGDDGLPTLSQTAGAKSPFPRDATLANGCVKPSNAKGKYIVEAYDLWKKTFVTTSGAPSGAMRVQSPEDISGNLNATVSEGIAYGMLIAVYMNDKTLFDGLLAYWKAHAGDGGSMLMSWLITSGGGAVNRGSATDADEDAAFALIMASRQWGGYATEISTILDQMWNNDVDSSTSGGPYLKPGSVQNFGGRDLTNPSYFAPAFYRVFAQVDTNSAHNWSGLVTSVYNQLGTISATNGLVPAWCTGNCTSRGGGGYVNAAMYQYDSHRAPWRIGLDACWNGESKALAYVRKTTSFFAKASATAGLGSLVDIYADDSGTAKTGAARNSSSLIGAAVAGAMPVAGTDAGAKSFLDRGYQFLLDASYTDNPSVKTGTTKSYTYYNASVGLLSLLTLTGNFVVLPKP
jgi:endo-1,4-beta-D-glucanase Y